MSASLSWMAWCSPMGLPMVWRWRLYSTEAWRAASATPTPRAATLMRPSSRAPTVWRKPWPSSLADQLVGGDGHVVEEQLDGVDALVPELASRRTT